MCNEKKESLGPFTRVIFQRNVPLPNGDTYGVEAAFSIQGAPYGTELLQALDLMVQRLDQSTVDGVAQHRGTDAGFAVADQVAAARGQAAP